MTCDDIQESLSFYGDDGLSEEARTHCDEHLEVCPVCREHLAEMRTIRRRLATLARPAVPAELVPTINNALAAEAAVQRARTNLTTVEAIVDWISPWLQPRLMRYAFSSVASLIIFASVFAALRPHMVALHDAATAFEALNATPYGSGGQYDINQPISPSSYAALRVPYNVESPSLNPNGGLAALDFSTAQTRNYKSANDDMVVIADVFSNGTASLADVIHSPRDRRLLDDFQEALRNNAAFVPASLDRRPETMRVIFSVQRVDVRESDY